MKTITTVKTTTVTTTVVETKVLTPIFMEYDVVSNGSMMQPLPFQYRPNDRLMWMRKDWSTLAHFATDDGEMYIYESGQRMYMHTMTYKANHDMLAAAMMLSRQLWSWRFGMVGQLNMVNYLAHLIAWQLAIIPITRLTTPQPIKHSQWKAELAFI